MDIQSALNVFINDGILAQKSPSTLKGYQYSVNSLIKYTKLQFISQDISNLNENVLTGYVVNGIKFLKWNKYTQWTQYKNLNGFFNWCMRKTFIQINPLLNLPKPRMPQQLPKSLNEKELLVLLRIVSNMPVTYHFYKLRNKAVISTFLFTGLRRSELINLKTSDVDLINGFIVVEHGKGDKRREIPIEQSTLKPILEEYINYRTKLLKTSEWFFNGTFRGRGQNDNKMAISTLDRLFHYLSKLCGKRIYAHKLRHSFATLFLDKTGDLFILKELLGHSSIKTTCIYLSTTRQKKTEAINKMSLI
jgi:site-specific recombinase XerD